MKCRNKLVATVLSVSLLLPNANAVFAQNSNENHLNWSTSKKVLVLSGILGVGALTAFGIWFFCKPSQKGEVKPKDSVVEPNGETDIQNTSWGSGRVEVIEGLKEAISQACDKYELSYILSQCEILLNGSNRARKGSIDNLKDRINAIAPETFEAMKLECGRVLVDLVRSYLESNPKFQASCILRIGWFERARGRGDVQKYCQEKKEQEKADREKGEEEKQNWERIQRGDLTPEEYECMFSTKMLLASKGNEQYNYWGIVQIIKPPIEVWEKFRKYDKFIHACGAFLDHCYQQKIVIPRQFGKDNEEFVKKICGLSVVSKIDVVDENGKSYKKELEETEAEKERKRKDPENIKRIKEGNLTDDEYRTLLFKKGDDFEYLAGVIKVLKLPSTILKEIKVDDLVSRICEIAYLGGDRLICVILSDRGDLGKQVIAGFKEKEVEYKKFIKVQDEKGNSYD